MKSKKFNIKFARKPLEIEFNEIAGQANGSVFVRYGETLLMATATMSKHAKSGMGYFPLMVDYEEKFYAAGQILGSRFIRREGRPSDEAVLAGRMIDRTLRPLFDHRIRNDVQVVVMALSIDGVNDPDVPAILAASLAVGTSDIPWNGPVGAIRIARVDGNFVLSPSYEQREAADFEILACTKDGRINMVEARGNEMPEEVAVEAIKTAQSELEAIEKLQKGIIKEVGKEKIQFEFPQAPADLKKHFEKNFRAKLEEAIYVEDKAGRSTAISDLKREWLSAVEGNFEENLEQLADDLYEDAIDDIIHKNILDEKQEKRPDSRNLKQIRRLLAEVGVLPRTHGSGLFFRGDTHVLSALTLGAPGDVQLIEGMEVQTKKRFMHHYNFPPFSVGEAGRLGPPKRREIGHGALVEKALEPVIPDQEKFPYTIRIVSECMSSNGSTSMASVCASTLALMDAGVPIKNPVAGIAMGLMTDQKGYKVLTDIQGPEDHHGDMDFKATGTKEGLTAIQMDVKIEGITIDMLKDVLSDAREARLKILEAMLKEIPSPRESLSPLAPRIIIHKINPDKIRDLIGPGGKIIRKIIEETGSQIDVEQDGTVYITAEDEEKGEETLKRVDELTHEYQVGEEFKKAKVSRIFDFGAMVEFAPGQEGLVHISQLSPQRVEKVTDVVDVGDEIPVKIIEIDDQGRINLSLKEMAVIEPKSGLSSRSSENHRPQNNKHNKKGKRKFFKK